MDSVEKKILISQNYSLATRIILLCLISEICCTILRLKGQDVSMEQNAILFDLNGVLYLWVLFIERKYILNFTNHKARVYFSWFIYLTIALYGIILIAHLYNGFDKAVVALISVITLFVSFYFVIRYGITLMQLKNDFIGLLKYLGLFNILLALITIIGFVPHMWRTYYFIISFYTINITTYTILILIMQRAKRFSLNTPN